MSMGCQFREKLNPHQTWVTLFASTLSCLYLSNWTTRRGRNIDYLLSSWTQGLVQKAELVPVSSNSIVAWHGRQLRISSLRNNNDTRQAYTSSFLCFTHSVVSLNRSGNFWQTEQGLDLAKADEGMISYGILYLSTQLNQEKRRMIHNTSLLNLQNLYFFI